MQNGKHLENLSCSLPPSAPLLSLRVWVVSVPLLPGEKRRVAQRRRDSQIAVQRDHAEGFYARRHAQHVGGRPEFTHEVSKLPHSQQDVAGAKRDHDQAHDEVGDCQRGDEEVGDGLEALEAQDGGDDQHVTWTRAHS